MSLTPAETDRLLRDLMEKNKSIASERDGMGDKVGKLMKRIKELEDEAADALASAEAANLGKSAVERDWSERLVNTEQDWALKLKRAEDEKKRLLAEKDKAAAAALHKAQSEQQIALASLEAEHKANLNDAKRNGERALESARAEWKDAMRQAAEEANTAAVAAAAKHATANEKLQDEHAAALTAQEREALERIANVQAEWRLQLDEAAEHFQKEKERLLAESRNQVAAAEFAATQRIQDIEAHWQGRLAATQKAAERESAGLRQDLDDKAAAIHARLHELLGAEASRERRAKALAVEFDALRDTAELEAARRTELEVKLRDAASRHKRVLAARGEEVSALREDLAALRAAMLLEPQAATDAEEEAAMHMNLMGRLQTQCQEGVRLSPEQKSPARLGKGEAGHVIGAVLGRSPGAHQYKSTQPHHKRGPLSSEDLDGWHADMSARLDAAMQRLSANKASPCA